VDLDYKKIDWLNFNENFTVINIFTDEECDKIIDSIEDNIDKLKISKDNGWLYLSAYEMDVKNLSFEIQTLINSVIKQFEGLDLNQSFIIKYGVDLISKMPGHYDCTYLSLPINLNNDFEGGSTYLPFLKHEHIPQKYPRGSGMIFKADTLKSWHEALPVTKGYRYVLVLKFNKKTNNFIEIFKIFKMVIASIIIKFFNKLKNPS
jgi:hypothetical protein